MASFVKKPLDFTALSPLAPPNILPHIGLRAGSINFIFYKDFLVASANIPATYPIFVVTCITPLLIFFNSFDRLYYRLSNPKYL